MNCNRCGKWAGAHATLPGQPKDGLCMCQPAPTPVMTADFERGFDRAWDAQQRELDRVRADRDSLRDALAALVRVAETGGDGMPVEHWHALEMARHVLGEKRA